VLSMLLSAFGIGIAVSIPVGAYAIAAGKRAITNGFYPALIFTIGSLVGDAFYALLAYLGLAPILNSSILLRLVLWGIGGAWLCWLGWDALLTRVDEQMLSGQAEQESRWQGFVSGFGLTIFNPLAIAGWIALAGSFFAGWDSDTLPLFPFGLLAILSMMTGATIYATVYVGLLSRIRRFVNPRILTGATISAGVFLIFFGLSAWWSAGQIVLAMIY